MGYLVNPIGAVRRSVSDEKVWLEIHPAFCSALLNLDKFSHIIVLWWISGRDNPDDRSVTVVIPRRHSNEPKLSGVFATRSPSRPNPIGLSVVRVLNVDQKKCLIEIDQIDAYDGSPIIDIKPYLPSSDRVDTVHVPEWFADLEPRYTDTNKV